MSTPRTCPARVGNYETTARKFYRQTSGRGSRDARARADDAGNERAARRRARSRHRARRTRRASGAPALGEGNGGVAARGRARRETERRGRTSRSDVACDDGDGAVLASMRLNPFRPADESRLGTKRSEYVVFRGVRAPPVTVAIASRERPLYWPVANTETPSRLSPRASLASPPRLGRRARWNDADECDDDAEERDVGSRCERALSCARGK